MQSRPARCGDGIGHQTAQHRPILRAAACQHPYHHPSCQCGGDGGRDPADDGRKSDCHRSIHNHGPNGVAGTGILCLRGQRREAAKPSVKQRREGPAHRSQPPRQSRRNRPGLVAPRSNKTDTRGKGMTTKATAAGMVNARDSSPAREKACFAPWSSCAAQAAGEVLARAQSQPRCQRHRGATGRGGQRRRANPTALSKCEATCWPTSRLICMTPPARAAGMATMTSRFISGVQRGREGRRRMPCPVRRDPDQGELSDTCDRHGPRSASGSPLLRCMRPKPLMCKRKY